MQNFKNKYQFKDYIADIAAELDINKETFDKIFAQVFLDIFEKEKQIPCLQNFFKINVINKVVDEIKKIRKHDKTIFLPLFEDYLRLTTELDDIIINIKKSCRDQEKVCVTKQECIINISKYPILLRIAEHSELESFKPDLTTSQEFIDLFKENIGKFGLYFLYNLNKELLYVGKSLNLGETIIDSVWKKNVDGFVAIAYTKTKADLYIYENYYILKEKPLLNSNLSEHDDELSISLKPLKKSNLTKIYTNN